jgi:hypothetical protein
MRNTILGKPAMDCRKLSFARLLRPSLPKDGIFMIATLLVGLSLTIGQSEAPKLGAPISAAAGGAQLLAPVDYREKPKADPPPAVLPPANPAPVLLPPATPEPKAIPDSTSPNRNGNGNGLGFFRTFWKADADLHQPVLFGAER